MVAHARLSHEGGYWHLCLIKVGSHWNDPCNRVGREVSVEEMRGKRPAVRDCEVPACPSETSGVHSHGYELTESRRSSPPARTGRRTTRR